MSRLKHGISGMQVKASRGCASCGAVTSAGGAGGIERAGQGAVVADDRARVAPVMIAYSVSRRALLAAVAGGKLSGALAGKGELIGAWCARNLGGDPQVVVEIGAEGGVAPRLCLRDTSGREVVELLTLPVCRRVEGAALVHLHIAGIVEASVRRDDYAARPLYVKSSLPEMLGVGGGRYEVV